jgi:hypothetical protein
MTNSRVETEWNAILAELGDAGLQCVLARHNLERNAGAAGAMAGYVAASERWTDAFLKAGDFVRDCPA